jgi:hypothetical protein
VLLTPNELTCKACVHVQPADGFAAAVWVGVWFEFCETAAQLLSFNRCVHCCTACTAEYVSGVP